MRVGPGATKRAPGLVVHGRAHDIGNATLGGERSMVERRWHSFTTGTAAWRRRAMLVGFALAGAAPAAAQAETVDRMTCAAAKKVVQATGGYEKRTGFGPLPIRPVNPESRQGYCPGSTAPVFAIEKTLDNPACVVGYTCQRRDRR
jgi:hypothetical protein